MGQRAAIHARVSTVDQRCERQVGELSAFAERGGFEVMGIFRENGLGGAGNNRLARNRVLELAQARLIEPYWSPSCPAGDARRRTSSTRSTGVPAVWKVSVVAMSGMTFDLDTPHGRMMTTILAGIAQFEHDLLSERVKSGLAAARARGRDSGASPGSTRNRTNSRRKCSRPSPVGEAIAGSLVTSISPSILLPTSSNGTARSPQRRSPSYRNGPQWHAEQLREDLRWPHFTQEFAAWRFS